ncbi:MAG TPA: putative baseplate assembly protein [Thermoanaerobaculia bacterium]|nr:putative baseplate assembly protein [Thermoanaerobaculia bacterium]
MKAPLLPVLDPRTARQLRDELLARRPAYVPEWLPSADGPDAALTGIAARYLETLLQRLNLAPVKNRMAFFDLLGIDLVTAQAARVPMVFQLSPEAPAVTLPEGSRVAAPPPPESTEQIVFETERAAGLSPARLVQVVSLWPGRDQWIDHSAALAAGKPIQAFKKSLLADTPHEIYIAHDTLLQFAGKVVLDVRFELVTPASEPLTILWEYFDGTVWRGFKGMRPGCEGIVEGSGDGTAGLTRSGRFRLEADCAETAKTTVHGIEAYWIRGRLTEPLPLDPEQVLPVVDDLRLSIHVARPLPEPAMPLFVALPPPVPVEDPVPIPEAVPLVRSESTARFLLLPGLLDLDVAAAIATPRSCPEPGDALQPDKAFFGAEKLDTSKAFYPFGQAPKPGDAFYFASEEILTKPGAEVTVRVCVTAPPTLQFTLSADQPAPVVLWEYWNGRRWQGLALHSTDPYGPGDPSVFKGSGTFRFYVPDDVAVTKVNEQEARWIRVRLHSGGYAIRATATFATNDPHNPTNTMSFLVPQPPALNQLRLGYTWEYGPTSAERVLAVNDFQTADHTEAARWPGLSFPPFATVSGSTPSLYLGFDRKLPVDRVNLYVDVEEKRGEVRGPELVWEAWDGFDWSRLTVEDETAHLRVPGMVSLIGPEDAAPAARFGTPLWWLRARLKEDGPPGEPVIRGLHPNAVWASQRETVVQERLGTSSGLPRQALGFRRFPVLAGEAVEVQELSGPRAAVEWRLLARELFGEAAIREIEEMLGREGLQTEVERGALRLRRDREKKVIEAWVRWEPREDFFRSGPADRHYVLERSRGRLFFGDGEQGRVPPLGAAILARSYRTGGGSKGNVTAGAVTQVLTGVPGLDRAWNPLAAEGGADAETLEALAGRAPLTVARRGRALTAAGLESLAREVSPAVAVARVVPTLDPAGRQRPGWVTLILIPGSDEPRPWPSLGLRRRVRQAVEARAAADFAAAAHLHVTGPDYLPVDVEVTIAPVDPADAGGVERRARAALETFLHPLRGGPERQGWAPGRGVYLSDIAAVLERVEGVDHVRELALLRDGQLQGERVAVRPDRIVVAGALRIKLQAGKD